MALKIRLTRRGAKKNALYRLVIQDVDASRDGKFKEIIGTYNPHEEEAKKLVYKKDRYDYWYGKGARPTQTVGRLVKKISAPSA